MSLSISLDAKNSCPGHPVRPTAAPMKPTFQLQRNSAGDMQQAVLPPTDTDLSHVDFVTQEKCKHFRNFISATDIPARIIL
jgi:hypothetical protein